MGRLLKLNRAVPGGRVELFAIPDDGKRLRYDNAYDEIDLGWHHRHITPGNDTSIEFHSITTHIARFLTEVEHLSKTHD
ncbi:hypothetical protein PNP85_12180 [Halobacterium salinarum]|uniref:DUF6516 family protein n=1 Tax=Halobacterium salinarum TaxID=2242 RepID=UPI002557139C|nr:DUF6516 family protein [Halobacterium salinarum]MDL0137501.1 hypothetical protein [Halobacterium salinarum]MDL0140259.1 hypothetical protein [Halobacterium salinarum]